MTTLREDMYNAAQAAFDEILMADPHNEYGLREQSVKRMEALIAEREQKANDDYDAALRRINTAETP